MGIYMSGLKIDEGFSDSIIKTIMSLGTWNFFLLLCFVSIGLNFFIVSVPRDIVKAVGRKLIDDVLKAACQSITLFQPDPALRAIVTLVDSNGEKRRTTFSNNIETDPERTAFFDATFGITGEALLKRNAKFEFLPEDHMNNYPEEIKRWVHPKIQWILAAPIYIPDGQDEPIGVLAIDTVNPESTINLNKRSALSTIQNWADIIGEIIYQTKIVEYHHYKPE